MGLQGPCTSTFEPGRTSTARWSTCTLPHFKTHFRLSQRLATDDSTPPPRAPHLAAQVVELAQHISSKCPSLQLAGLMTIGMPDYSSRPENFTCLQECRWACPPGRGGVIAMLEAVPSRGGGGG
jgi:hypothetical protein